MGIPQGRCILSGGLVLVPFMWLAAAATQSDAQPPVFQHPGVGAVEAELAQHGSGPDLEIARLLYRYSGYTPQWTTGDGPAAARVFLHRLERAEDDGLCPRTERVESLHQAPGPA